MEDDDDKWSVVPSRGRESKLPKDQMNFDCVDENHNDAINTPQSRPRLEKGQSSTLQKANISNGREDVRGQSLIGSFFYRNTDKPSAATVGVASRPNGLPMRRPMNSIVTQATPTGFGYNADHGISDTRNRNTSDSDLIGAPIVVPSNHDYHGDLHPSLPGTEGVGDSPVVGVAKRERGLLRLKPGVLGPSIKANSVLAQY